MPFAPSTIRIRYGPDGLLAAAAGEVGRVQGARDRYDATRSRDLQFLNSELDRRQRARELAAGNELEARKLQDAFALGRQRINAQSAPQQSAPAPRAATVTDAGSLRPTGLADGVRERKTLLRQAAFAGTQLDPEQQSILDLASQSDQVDEKSFRDIVARIGDTVANRRKETAAQEKQTASQRKNEQIPARTELFYRNQRFDEDIRKASKERERILKSMSDQGIDPLASPASFNPTYRNPEEGLTRGFGFLGNINDALNPFGDPGNLVTDPGDPQGVGLMKQLTRTDNQIRKLQEAREGLVQSATSGTMRPGPGQVRVRDNQTGEVFLIDKATGQRVQ